MTGLIDRMRHAAHLARTYVTLTGPSRQAAPRFAGVETFCAFIGYSRSGHSVVAAVLDAHPHAVIAHEQGVLRYVYARFDRERLFTLLLRNAQTIGHTKGFSGQRSGGYSYEVDGQWQGRSDEIRVIGDKHGEDTTCRLDADPDLADRLHQTAAVPVRYVHVVRNPFDNIATMAVRRAGGRHGQTAEVGPDDLRRAADRYFSLCDANARIKTRVGTLAVRDVRHEEFVRNPKGEIAALCRWLGLEPSDEYLQASADLVFDNPRRSRDAVHWPDTLRNHVQQRIGEFAFLTGYDFTSA